jgi:hypothetical protein
MIDVVGAVSGEVVESIAVVSAQHKTLEDVVRWGLAQKPPRLVERVIVQDEYTHDVAIRYGEGVYLVYDTT